MTVRQALQSALHLLILLTFFTGGFFFLAWPKIQLEIAAISYQIALGFFIATAFLWFCFYLLNRGRYLRIKMGQIDARLIHAAVEKCLQTQFPKKISLIDVETPHSSRLEFYVSIPEKDDKLFAQVEKELQILLRKRFGYLKPFFLIVK